MGKICVAPILRFFPTSGIGSMNMQPKKIRNVYPKVDFTSLRPKCSLWFLSGIVASKMMIKHIGHKDRMPSFLKMSEHFLCETKGLMQNDVLQVGVLFFTCCRWQFCYLRKRNLNVNPSTERRHLGHTVDGRIPAPGMYKTL